jgi:Xaa-Pro dipeptidase
MNDIKSDRRNLCLPIGIGGKTPEQALAMLDNMTDDIAPISVDEYRARIHKAQTLMQQQGIDALFVNAGTNLEYFTGLRWYASERLVGAVIPANGEFCYIAPHFEIGSIRDFGKIETNIHTWHEHDDPYQRLLSIASSLSSSTPLTLAMDESTPFFVVDGIRQRDIGLKMVNAKVITAACRMHKSANEIAIIQRAMDMTLAVHKAAASILCDGISTIEVAEFINEAHKKVGASGSYFCIVLFGEASSYPHGVKHAQTLKAGDIVLIDTGCKLHGYTSDITRTYVFGEPTDEQRQVWQHEKNAQAAAFSAAQLGETCGNVDAAARAYLASVGLGPDYDLPGCPHRTGHGLGMDIHEWPYLVKDNPEKLAVGMCFSNEPMIVLPGKFGVRLEDHFYISNDGPKWFTTPSHSIDDPFGLSAR